MELYDALNKMYVDFRKIENLENYWDDDNDRLGTNRESYEHGLSFTRSFIFMLAATGNPFWENGLYRYTVNLDENGCVEIMFYNDQHDSIFFTFDSYYYRDGDPDSIGRCWKRRVEGNVCVQAEDLSLKLALEWWNWLFILDPR